MRKRNSIIFFILLLGCEEAEIDPKEYPFVLMREANTSDKGVQFIAEVIGLGNETILYHGFTWGEEPSPNIEIHDSKTISTDLKVGKFVAEINSGMILDQTYYVRPFIKTTNLLVYGSELSFVSQGSRPPNIIDFEPKFGPAGTKVEIIGENFGYSASSNIVKFGETIAEIDSATGTKLYVKVPYVTEPGEVNIMVETAEMSTSSIETFDLYFPWLKIQGVTHNLNGPSTAFVLEEKAFVINPNTFVGIKLNSLNQSWEHFILPEYAGSTPLAFTIANKAYVLLNSGFWEYDVVSDIWSKKSDFPENISDGRYVFTMSFDQLGFIGFCYRNQNLWSYNPANDKWVRKSDFPHIAPLNLPVWGNFSFSIGDSGYVGISQSGFALNTFWKYDVITDSWESKAPLPSNAYGRYACMVINEEAYVGLGQKFTGRTFDNTSNEIWRYNHPDDSWEPYQNCPTYMAAYASFGLGEKGYVLPGFTKSYRRLTEIWEFDPREN